MLAKIKKDFFKGVDLAEASQLKGEEHRAFRLAQVERLLTEKAGYSTLATWLSDQFWTADRGRMPMHDDNPLLSLKEQQTLTDEEMACLRLILEIAGLCHDLVLHFTFDLKEAFGVKNKLWISNKQLVEWLSTTEYEHIAMHMAYILKKYATNVYANTYYQPAQDELAELFSSEHGELIREPDMTDMPPRDYAKTILDELLRIERHWQRGRRLGLDPELVILHDEIYGVVPHHFDKGVLKAAQVLYDYMDKELRGKLVLEDYDENATSWDEQPESVKRITADVLNRFVAKVREVRAEYLAEGWIADYSLEINYLMAHAERCGDGVWREEGKAL